MPCDYKKYPENWKDIVKHEKERAEDKCELCGAPNHEFVYREDAVWDFFKDIFFSPKHVKIILTVHHIDGDLKNNRYPNLIVLCQRCHLRLDLGKHIANRRGKHGSKPTH